MAKISREELLARLKKTKLLALDVDGVLTDDSIFFGPDGFELKKFNISDGFFIVLSMRAGLEIAIVSGRYSAATDTRMKDLGVKHVFQGRKYKSTMIEPLMDEMKIGFDQVAFIGNELLDIELAEKVGLSVAVADSSKGLLGVVDFVTEHKGGEGAVRELLEHYFEAVGIDPRSFIKG